MLAAALLALVVGGGQPSRFVVIDVGDGPRCEAFEPSADGFVLTTDYQQMEPVTLGRFLFRARTDATGLLTIERIERELIRPHGIARDGAACRVEIPASRIATGECDRSKTPAVAIAPCIQALGPVPQRPATSRALSAVAKRGASIFWLRLSPDVRSRCEVWTFHPKDGDSGILAWRSADGTRELSYEYLMLPDGVFAAGPKTEFTWPDGGTEWEMPLCGGEGWPADDVADGEFKVGPWSWFTSSKACEQAAATRTLAATKFGCRD